MNIIFSTPTILIIRIIGFTLLGIAIGMLIHQILKPKKPIDPYVEYDRPEDPDKIGNTYDPPDPPIKSYNEELQSLLTKTEQIRKQYALPRSHQDRLIHIEYELETMLRYFNKPNKEI